MPNWTQNNITFESDDPEALANLKAQVGAPIQTPGVEYVRDEDGKIALDKNNHPVLKHVTHVEKEPIFSFWNIVQPSMEEWDSYRNQGWYDWNVDNWGTKWDVSGDVEVLEESDNHWNISFATAWAPPHEALVKLSEQHPEVSIRNEWVEEQGFGAHQEYVEGTYWVDKEWNIPESHEEYEENIGEQSCPCYSYGADEEDSFPFDDCPRENPTTKMAVAELEKVSELI